MQTINLVPLQQHVERIGERIDAIVKGGPPPANSEASRAAADKLGVLAFHFAALAVDGVELRGQLGGTGRVIGEQTLDA